MIKNNENKVSDVDKSRQTPKVKSIIQYCFDGDILADVFTNWRMFFDIEQPFHSVSLFRLRDN